MSTTKSRSPAYLWVELSVMEKTVWAAAYANAKRSAAERARAADLTVRSLRNLERRREGSIGPEYDAARCNIMLDLPTFEAWYRVQSLMSVTSARPPTKDECAEAYERYRRGLGDFY